MEISGKLNSEEALAVQRLLGGGKWYRLTLPHLGIAIFGLIPLVFAIQVVASKAVVNLSDSLWIFFGCPAIAAVIWLLGRMEDGRAMRRMIAELPKCYDFNTSGVVAKFSNGVMTSLPWTVLPSWQIKGSFLIFSNKEGQVLSVISLTGLTPDKLEFLRALLVESHTQ